MTKAWLTPDSDILTNPLECRTISIPGDLWLYVQGALELLTNENNWELFGDATPEEMAQYFMDVLDNFSLSVCQSDAMIINPAGATLLFNGSGSGTTTLDILQSSLPVAAQGCKGLLISMRWSASKHLILTLSTNGNHGFSPQSMQDEISDSYEQLILPMDATGGKILIDAVGGAGAWNSVIYLCGWWF